MLSRYVLHPVRILRYVEYFPSQEFFYSSRIAFYRVDSVLYVQCKYKYKYVNIYLLRRILTFLLRVPIIILLLLVPPAICRSLTLLLMDILLPLTEFWRLERQLDWKPVPTWVTKGKPDDDNDDVDRCHPVTQVNILEVKANASKTHIRTRRLSFTRKISNYI